MNKSLVLTGMMGVGKSTIGRILAKKLNTKFIDVDKIIEKSEKRSIKKIFQIDGENYFRKLEEKTTIKILKSKKAVIALGGGAFMNDQIRSEVLKSCVSFWLSLRFDQLIKRYKRNNRRPLLNKENLENDVKKIYKSRKKVYRLADFRIKCDNIEKSKIVQKILIFYEN